MLMQIREANLEDLGRLVELSEDNTKYHEQFRNMRLERNKQTSFEQKKELKEYLRNRNAVVLVVVDKEIIGYMIASIQGKNPYLKYRKRATLEDAYVIPSFRKQGIGRRMFMKIIRWLKDKKVERISVSVNAKNTSAIKAWKKYGFKEVVKQLALELK